MSVLKMRCFSSFLCCFLLLLTFVASERVKRQGFFGNSNRCRTPDNYNGVCVALPNCPSLLQLYSNNGGSQQIVTYLRQSQRSCGNTVIRGNPVLCCSQPTNNGGIQNTNGAQNSNFTPNPNNPFLPNNGQRPTPPPQTQPPTVPPTPPTTTKAFVPPPPPTPSPNRPIQQRIGDCVGPDARSGSCKSLIECPELLNRLQSNPSDASFAQFLRLSNELCNTAPPVICCPDANRNVFNDPIIPTLAPTIKPLVTVEARLLSPQEGCGQSSVAHRKIVGGAPSQLGSWPWLALLGYDSTEGIAFRCGGSLVTKRHVVTAAHCIQGTLRMIRMGEHDLDRDDETRHMDVNVLRTITHPSYNKRNGHSDVAVVVLSRDVVFTSTISPVCVPDNINTRSLVGHTPFVAGWGRTKEGGESASILQEVQIPILPNSECKERYRAQNRLVTENQFDDAIVCAGVLTGGKDTCQGDSGGPLMLPEKLNGNFYYNLLGVVSYGIGCAREGVPGVYASVPFFVDWIKEKIAEPI